MTAVGGDIQEVSISGVNFAVASQSDVKFRLGGTKVTVRPNGNGKTARYTSESEEWSLSGIDIEINHDRDDLGFLQRTADALEPVNCTITLVDGVVYQGKGLLVDEHDYSTAKATSGLTLAGEGQLARQYATF
jgi:hypothetical protein